MINITDDKLQELTKIFQPVTSYKFNARECAILAVSSSELKCFWDNDKTLPIESEFKFYWYPRKLNLVIKKHPPITYNLAISLFLMKDSLLFLERRQSINNKVVNLKFVNGRNQGIEKRWEQFIFQYNKNIKRYQAFSVVYSAMIHIDQSKITACSISPIINFVTSFPVYYEKGRLSPTGYNTYLNLLKQHSPQQYKDTLTTAGDDDSMKFKNIITNTDTILTKEQLNEMSYEELNDYVPLNEEALFEQISAMTVDFDPLLLPYYEDDDEYYYHRFDEVEVTDEMSKRLIKYNHRNVDVLNELLINYRANHNDNYPEYNPAIGWPKYHHAIVTIGHGFPQEIVYKALQECFGENEARNTWLKYYDELPVKENSYDQYYRR